MYPMDAETVAASLLGMKAAMFAFMESHPNPALLAAKLYQWIEQSEMLLSDTQNSDRVIELTKRHVQLFHQVALQLAQNSAGNSPAR